MSRLLAEATDIIELGDGDFAEVKRRMAYGDTRRLAAMFSGPAPMEEYLAGVLEVNLVALRGPGFGCTLQHDHGAGDQRCDAPAVSRTVIDSLDPEDAEVVIDAIQERNRALRKRKAQAQLDAAKAAGVPDPLASSRPTHAPSSNGTTASSTNSSSASTAAERSRDASPTSASSSAPDGPGTS